MALIFGRKEKMNKAFSKRRSATMFRNSISVSRSVYTVSSTKVRDGIIKAVEKEMSGTQFQTRLLNHLKKMGKRSLDKYNDIEFILQEYNVVLKFRTGAIDGEAMGYTLENLDYDPNPSFKPSGLEKLAFWNR